MENDDEYMDYDSQRNQRSQNYNKQRAYESNVELDDIQFENDLYDEPNPSSMAEHPASGQNRKSRTNTNYPSGGEGRPNKISQYKVKQNMSGSGDQKKRSQVEDHGSSDRRRQRFVDNDNEARNMSMDDSFGSPRNQGGKQQPNDYEIKQAVQNLDEVTQILEITQNFEKNYGAAKKKVNSFDVVTLESDVTTQAMKMCYQIIHGFLYEENPNFDQEKMEFKLEQMYTKSTQVNQEYQKFKGEFLAINETVINKDMMNFKLDRIQRYKDKQEANLQKLPSHEDLINEIKSNLVTLKKQYKIFEQGLFEKKNAETKYVIKDTNQLIQKIQDQHRKINKELVKAKDDLGLVIPQSREQRQRLQKIHGEINNIDNRLTESKQDIEVDLKEKDTLDIKHSQCEEIQQKLGTTDLPQMISQSRKLIFLVQNHNQWLDLNKRLKMMLDEDLNTCEFDLQKAMQDTKKYVDAIRNTRKDEYDDLIRQTQRLSKKISNDSIEQEKRLESFEAKMIPTQGAQSHIPESDLLFIKKEVARYRASIVSVKAQNEQNLDDSMKLNNDNKRDLSSSNGISLDDLQQLRQNLQSEKKMDSIDIPRIKRNIDNLEGFSLKSLKNKINDDNKRSQVQISKMKKNYEDLQKQIDALNGKLTKTRGSIDGLKDHFANEDLERENEITNRLDDKWHKCDFDINGDKSEAQRSTRPDRFLQASDEEKEKSLQAQKKKIIGQINKMVNQFNENNKLIKDSNKTPKSEKEMNDLIKKNIEIQNDCQKIDDQITDARDQGKDVDKRLDELLDPTIQDIKDKYDDKNQAIDECDELFDKANLQIERLDNVLDRQLTKIGDIIGRLDSVNPISNPTPSGKDNTSFLNLVQEKLDTANNLRDELEKMQEKLAATRDKMINHVQPLNDLNEREVTRPEIEEILKSLDNINDDLMNQERDILPKSQDIDDLEKDVDGMLESDKSRKIEDGEGKLQDLNNKIDDLNLAREDAFKKINEYKNLIFNAKANQSKNDPELAGKLKTLETEAKLIEKELIDLDDKINDLKKKRNDAKKLLDEVNQNPNKFTPQQIDAMLSALDDQRDKAESINDKLRNTDELLDEKIRQLKDLLSNSDERRELNDAIAILTKDLDDELKQFKDVLDQLPEKMALMQETLNEEKNGSEPDETADYWEEKKNIEDHLVDLKRIKIDFDKIIKLYTKKKQEVDGLKNGTKRNLDNEGLAKVLKDLQDVQRDLQEKSSDAFDLKDEVESIKKKMGECEIPVNIALRGNEMETLTERLERIKDDFKDLKQADDDFEGNSGQEQDIKKAIAKVGVVLRGFDQERADLQKFQTYTLEKYKQKDFISLRNAFIIIEVREHKAKIVDINERLKELEEMMSDLNTKLIQQDMENATKLLQKKAKKLRERLQAAQEMLEKISECGRQMDGNTTHNEEDEFIDALKDEMPEVFKNIDANFGQIDGIDVLLQQVIETRSIEKMSQLKKETDDATKKVEQSEGLVQKLENEIIEWDARKKLCTRDEELQQIDELLMEFRQDLKVEKLDMEKELNKNQLKQEKEGDPKGDLAALRDGILNFLGEIEDLEQSVTELKQEKDVCFEEFDEDLPKIVKQERVARYNASEVGSPKNKRGPKKAFDMNVESDKPHDIYYMIFINCKYKKRIHAMLKELRLINGRRRELESKYAPLKRDLTMVKEVKVYKPLKGDEIDAMFANALQRAQCNLPIKRLSAGKYLFGTKQILAKIINGKLVIRVGGGYMSVDEFIETYAKQEMAKMIKLGQLDPDTLSKANAGKDGALAGGAMSMADMKNQLRGSLANVKTYETGNVFGMDSNAPKGRVVSGKSNNLLDLETKYDAKGGFGQSPKNAKSPPPQRTTKFQTSTIKTDRSPDPYSRRTGQTKITTSTYTTTENKYGQGSPRR